jgi:DNA-binding XRE family transcriptional regulator
VIVLKSKSALNQKLIKNGFSKRGFAKEYGLAEATFIQISNGKRSPRPQTAKKICEALKVGFDEVFEIVEQKNE